MFEDRDIRHIMKSYERMKKITRNFFNEAESVFKDMTEHFSLPELLPSSGSLLPSTKLTSGIIRSDFHEEDDKYIITCDMPGIKKENISISLKEDKRLLIIHAKREEGKEENNESKNYFIKERVYAEFKRSFVIPENADLKNIKPADLKDGVLTIIIPKLKPDNQDEKVIKIDFQ